MKRQHIFLSLLLILALLLGCSLMVSAEKTTEKASEQSKEKSADKAVEQSTEQSTEKSAEKSDEKPMVQPPDFEAETQLHQFRSHGGDRGELTDTFQALFDALKEGKDGSEFIAEGTRDKQSILDYFERLKAFEKLDELSVANDLFYQVKESPVFYNMRALSAFTYFIPGKDGEKWMYTDRLAMAKLGPEEKDWKIWKVLHLGTPLNVADVELIQLEPPKEGEEICIIETDAGDIKCRIFPEEAPKAIENLKGLAKQGFYDGKLFHRVIPEFVIQGGAENDTPEEGLSFFGEPFEDEFADNLFNFRGALSLANAGPNTNGNQFFIVQNTKVRETDLDLTSLPLNVEKKYLEIGGLPHLDFRHVVIGQVFEGMEVVDKIANQKTDDEARPLKDPIKMVTIRFEKYKK